MDDYDLERCPRCGEQAELSDLVAFNGRGGAVCADCGEYAEQCGQDGQDLPTAAGVLWRRRCDSCGDWWAAEDTAACPSGHAICSSCSPMHTLKRAGAAFDAMVVLAMFLARADDTERGWLAAKLDPGSADFPPDCSINYTKLITDQLSELTYKI